MRFDYIVDTHTHIDMLEAISSDEAVKNAYEYGVKRLILPCSDAKDINIVNELSLRYENVYALLGVHPSEIAGWNIDVADKIRKLIKENRKIVGIGEIGLDYHWDDTNKDEQKQAFIDQVMLANELKLPICIHDRDAHKDTLDILKEYNNGSPGVLHCFSGSVEFMRECIKEGYYIALGGVVTFKNAQKVRDVAKEVPLERLLLETDAPFLTPEPYRGKENQPAYTKFVAEKIAQIREISIEEVINITTENAYNLYNLDRIN